jgi:acetyltransferase-like isoleucine patch superfamily enzyme
MIQIIGNVLKRVRRTVELNRYDDFTIAEYLRKQGAEIGEDCRIEVRGLGTEPFLIRIGNHCTIGPDVWFLTHDGGTWLFTEEIPGLQKFGTIEILDNCFIGARVMLLPNVRVGPNAIVGAGSVVTKDVAPDSVVAGNPARIVSSLDEYRQKVLETWRVQEPKGYFASVGHGARPKPRDIHATKLRDRDLLREHLTRVLWAKKS